MVINQAEKKTDVNLTPVHLKPFSPIAIGSLPYKNLDVAMDTVRTNFSEIPFWPQLTELSKNEDMVLQFSENMPLFFVDGQKSYMAEASAEFQDKIEEFLCDYKEIITNINCKTIEKYAISTHNSAAFPEFLKIIKTTRPEFAKGQIAGPFTLAAAIIDTEGKCVFHDVKLREIITKTLTLKALWQIKQIKCANFTTTPIIFIDEPSLETLKPPAFDINDQNIVISMLKEISNFIQQNGAISAVHCCSKCNWYVPLNSGVDIINPDAYRYTRDLSFFYKEIKPFLDNGGKIAWGIIPTLNRKAIFNTDLQELTDIFERAVKYLTKTGINEKLILKNSLITPSCGTGGLDDEMASKAMTLTAQLSKKLKEKYSIDY